jgi:hypothetical protein
MWHKPCCWFKICRNAFILCFAKKFTTITYKIGIGCVRYSWKALGKCHTIFKKEKNQKNHLIYYSLSKAPKPKFGFKEF